jgi:hypothetical protein
MLTGGKVLPHRDAQDQIKRLATCLGSLQKRQAIVKPFNVALVVEGLSRLSQLPHWLDG